jgi:hypothetical protein
MIKKKWIAVYAEDGEEFQTYRWALNGHKVAAGTLIGYEKYNKGSEQWELELRPDIKFG